MARLVSVMLGATALVLSSCSSDTPQAEPIPTPPPSAPSSSPASTVPTTSPPAQETAEEFVQRWIETSTQMQASGDPTTYLSMQRGCRPCAQLASRVDRIYTANGRIEFSGYTKPQVEAVGAPARMQFVFQGIAPTTRFRNSSEAAWESITGGKTALLVTLGQAPDQSWFVKHYGRTSYE